MGRGGPIGELAASFAESITARIETTNNEIKKACSNNSSNFAETTRELIKIQSETQEIQTLLTDLGIDFKNSVKFLNDVFSQLAEHRSSLDSIDKSIEALETAIPVLELYGSIRDSIESKRQYHALKSLSNLERNKLPHIKKYSFSSAIRERIPLLRSEIKNASLTEVTSFLEKIRSKSIDIGEIALRQTAVANGILINDENFSQEIARKQEASDSSAKRRLTLTNFSTLNVLTFNENMTSGSSSSNAVQIEVDDLNKLFRGYQPFNSQFSDEKNGTIESLSVLDSILDFTPVYRCMHIHTVLNEKLEFEKHYCNQRKKQLDLTLSLSPKQETLLKDYMSFYSSIIGFFKVDECLRHTLPSPSSIFQGSLEDNWSKACKRLVTFVENNAGNEMNTLEDIIRLKDYTELFCRTMFSLGFSMNNLSELTPLIRKKYEFKLKKEYNTKFDNIFKEDNYSFIILKSPADIMDNLHGYCLEDYEIDYPKTLHYSLMVPRIYGEITKFVEKCKDFNINIDISLTEIEENINRATNSLILEDIKSLLEVHIDNSKQTLSKLVQLCLNISEYERMCTLVGSYIDRKLNPDLKTMAPPVTPLPTAATTGNIEMKPNISRIVRRAVEIFKRSTGNMTQVSANESWSNILEKSTYIGITTKIGSEIEQVNAQFTFDCAREFRTLGNRCEEAIYEHLEMKINTFIENVHYDGIDKEGSFEKNGRKESDQVREMLQWLVSNFHAFSHLPPKVAQTACFKVCKHILNCLSDFLLGDQIRSISKVTIDQVSCDLALCEEFAKSDIVTGIDESSLTIIFASLRQLINLYRNNDWDEYIKLYGSENYKKYNRVRPDQCISLLEKLREGKSSGFLTFLNREDRDLKKNYDEIIRRLKEKKKDGFHRTDAHS